MARSRKTILICLASVVVLISVPGVATGQAHDPAAHSDPVTPVILALAVILTAAKFAGHLAVRVGQPAVLGELVAGVALGSADLLGLGWFHAIETDATVEILARIGVLILLFEVGLESTVRDMLKVGLPSLLVAVLGVAAPFALGWGVGRADASRSESLRARVSRRHADGDQRRHHGSSPARPRPFADTRSPNHPGCGGH